jgi:cytochrome c oxidase subunit II
MSSTPRTRSLPGTIWAWLLVTLIVVGTVLVFVTGAWRGLFPVPAATQQGQEIRDLYNIVFFFAVIIFIVVEGLIVWTVLRYRRKPEDRDLPPQTHGNNFAEILWTVIPTVIVAFLFYVSWQTLNSVDTLARQPDVHIRAVAGQFQWTFDYLDENGEEVLYTQRQAVGDDGGLFVPVGQTVQLHLSSPDVIHSFYVPAFLYKRDVNPGMVNRFDFNVHEDYAGERLHGQCAELCGAGHRIMVFDVHPLTPGDFQAWLQERIEQATASPVPTDEIPVEVTLELVSSNIAFDQTTLEVPPDRPFAIHHRNNDPRGVLHDVDIRTQDGTVIADTELIDGGEERTYVYEPLPAGTYTFFCSIHPIPAMTGTLTVR